MATFSLVPTPSALETRIGSFHFLLSSANSAPNPPIPPSTPGVKVLLAWWRMRCLAASASTMSTPASAYFMNGLPAFFGNKGAQIYLSFSFGRIFACRRAGFGNTCLLLPGTVGLKSPEQPSPAHQARMHQRIGVRKEALANLTRLPSVRGDIQRHVYHDRRADNVLARHRTPEAAVVRVPAVIAHHEIRIVRNLERLAQIVRIGAADGVVFFELLAVHPHGAVVDLNRISGQADHAFDIIRRIRRKGRLENDDLLAMRIAPQRHVPIGEGHPSVVADAAHDQVIANEKRVLHGAGGNHAGLADSAVNQQKNQRHPEPGDDFVLYLLAHRNVTRLLLFVALRFRYHVPPPRDVPSSPLGLRRWTSPPSFACHCRLPIAPGPSDRCRCSRTCSSGLAYRLPLALVRPGKCSPANRLRYICKFPPACWRRRSILPAWAYRRRSSTAKSWAGN